MVLVPKTPSILPRRASRESGEQSVTGTTSCFNRIGPKGEIDLAAQIAHVDFYDVVRAIEVPIPNTLHYLGLRYHSVFLAHQVFEHAEFPRRKRDCRIGARDQSSGWIEGEGPSGQHNRTVRSPTSDQCVQPPDEPPKSERLCQVVIGSEFESIRLVEFTVLGGEHQHRYPYVAFAELSEHLVSAETGQHD